jgi:hypothetical protein
MRAVKFSCSRIVVRSAAARMLEAAGMRDASALPALPSPRRRRPDAIGATDEPICLEAT